MRTATAAPLVGISILCIWWLRSTSRVDMLTCFAGDGRSYTLEVRDGTVWFPLQLDSSHALGDGRFTWHTAPRPSGQPSAVIPNHAVQFQSYDLPPGVMPNRLDYCIVSIWALVLLLILTSLCEYLLHRKRK